MRGAGPSCSPAEGSSLVDDVITAALLIARRIRPYVPQRHTLPRIAASMSASLGAGFCASNAAAAMICPDWQ